MKSLILTTGIIPLLLIILGSGCGMEHQENERFWEISPESTTSMIETSIDGIGFKFCLLNEQGEPSTIFKEGENFSFYFSVKNNRNERLIFFPEYTFVDRNDFCRVYSDKNEDLGKPFHGLPHIDLGGLYPFESGESCVFEQAWLDNREMVNWWKGCCYHVDQKEPLEKGSYYTSFNSRFQFDRSLDKPSLKIDTLNFRINFKIQ